MNSWIDYSTSLSKRLLALSGDATLDLLKHEWEAPDSWDVTTLKLNSQVIHREIIMNSHNIPCWYARTIIPEATYLFDFENFKQLGIKPLGDIIYNHPHLRRDINPYEIYENMPEFQYLKAALKENTPTTALSGRLSTFIIQDTAKFYLLEIFLPGILKYCETT